ncbi:hypothetical protein FAM21834_01090 [Lentilactobacillus parabuchneri]|uniref:Uncharacterized protein n=3 Tax=Lentilactobacillus parabuchneri TaxID=152331 RepID=A0A1X1FE37_9LACO|nr:hypothetical protein [Lentilactobacillus parabuchneri]APR07748.1 hypothetical protein FAM21731_01574 [Lentilactobacillus parabuchneri]MBW0222277.1 hypothetical protein [Lentilactobacillus parabuchneri]MBW0245486.1 hypothetical protein [Lentilactobacillus parabuchneri]MBW0263554.1 hypothetical protein [Lentilactobacillus parabuchneri]MCT2883462.1 hypothetical protein [Lentilactobacillus parabuchneri]
MPNIKRPWCIDVKYVNGMVKKYRLTMDLQHALNGDPQGRNLLQNALIVVPLAPYLEFKYQKKMSKDAWKRFKVKTQPPFGIGRIIKFYQLSSARAHKFPVSRSQFVAAEYWKAGPYARVNRYLRHDYKWLTKCQISADITYWQRQLYLKKPHPNGCCRLLTWIRVQIRLKQCQRQWFAQEKRLWHV